MQDLMIPSFVNTDIESATDNAHSVRVEMIAPRKPKPPRPA